MKARSLIFLLVATALGALLVPGATFARARPASRHSVTPPEVSAEFTLNGTDGYEIKANVVNRQQLDLVALRWGDVIESESYSLRLRGRRATDEIVADLGRFGRVDMRFVPGKVRREKPPDNVRVLGSWSNMGISSA